MIAVQDLPPQAPIHRHEHHHHPSVEPTGFREFAKMSPLRAPRLLISYGQVVDHSRISITLDAENQDWHVDAAPNHSPAAMRLVLAKLSGWGYIPIPEEECEPDLLDNGATRIYFYPERGAIIA